METELMYVPFTAHAIEIDEKRKKREQSRQYYAQNRDQLRERNRQRYHAKKETGLSEGELERRRADNRRSYHRRRDGLVLAKLEELKATADESRLPLLQELIDEKNYANWSPQTLEVVAFLVAKKHRAEGTNE
jgi:hypothetical protein